MTKKEFIEAMKDMPDDAEVYFWNFNTLFWSSGKPYLLGEEEHKFIGIE